MHPDYVRFIDGIREHVPDAKVIVDVGALEGAGAINVKEAFPGATVYAVDPINLDVNACILAGVVPVIATCSDRHGTKTLTRSLQPGLTSMHSRGIDEAGQFISATFPAYVLGADALKIDAEGAAYEVICGALTFGSRLIQVETERIELFAGQILEAKCFEALLCAGFRQLWEERSGEQTESLWLR